MKKIAVFITISVYLIACGGGPPLEQRGSYPLTFEPDSVTLSGKSCATHIKVQGDIYEDVTLTVLIVTLTDKNDTQNKITFTDTDLESLFGTIFLSRASLLEGNITIEGSSRGMIESFDTSIVLTGITLNGYARTWAGVFECIQQL